LRARARALPTCSRWCGTVGSVNTFPAGVPGYQVTKAVPQVRPLCIEVGALTGAVKRCGWTSLPTRAPARPPNGVTPKSRTSGRTADQPRNPSVVPRCTDCNPSIPSRMRTSVEPRIRIRRLPPPRIRDNRVGHSNVARARDGRDKSDPLRVDVPTIAAAQRTQPRVPMDDAQAQIPELKPIQ
jgi:hypothetical protein